MSSAARTNLTSQDVKISNYTLGEGEFRVCLLGTYVGGNRNGQEAACKRFKPEHRSMENEYFNKDFQIADITIQYAEQWNAFCEQGKEILVSKGYIRSSNSGIKYLIEPMIRDFTKFTSNNGWIASEAEAGWAVLAMEAFSHFTYHASNGQLMVADLQGRYRFNRRANSKSRFELTDPAICSRSCGYGPTDLGEKGMHSFFSSHCCNRFCQSNWARPSNPRAWFARTQGTSMVPSRMSHHLALTSRATFHSGLAVIQEPPQTLYSGFALVQHH